MSSSQVCRAHLSSVFAGQKLDSKEKEDRGEEKSRRYRVTGDITTAEWGFPPRSVRPFIRALSAPSVILPQNGRADLFFLSSPFIVHLPSPRNTSFLEETSSSSSSRSVDRVGRRDLSILAGQNEISHHLVAPHQVFSSSSSSSTSILSFPSTFPLSTSRCISAYAVNNARVNGKSSVNVLSVETIPCNVPGGIVRIAEVRDASIRLVTRSAFGVGRVHDDLSAET